MAAQTALARLEQILAQHPHSPASTRVELTLGQVRDLSAQVAILAETVVMAAALWFGQITHEGEAGYASESLHELALDLVEKNPRLRGAFKAEA